MLVDYHMHLELDSDPGPCPYHLERLRVYCEHARAAGVDEIAITEHCNRFEEFRPAMQHLCTGSAEQSNFIRRSFRERLAPYVETLQAARAAGLPVKTSIEVDFIPGREAEIRAALADYPWDFLLGSVHFLGDWGLDMDPAAWTSVDVDAVYQRYFDELERAARSGLFDVLAHPDLPKVFGRRPSAGFDLQGCFERIAQAAAECNLAIEISTAGLRKPVGELYPAPAFLPACAERGVPVTLASDAHEPEFIGADYDRAVAFAREHGIERVAVFEGRTRRLEPLGRARWQRSGGARP
ncbi:MAG TPA: histidinol-phosphatase [Limnochordia bacterium]|nr:histidinol-phosphatase [Limnochordia bacterium]